MSSREVRGLREIAPIAVEEKESGAIVRTGGIEKRETIIVI
jgi:hypothetical protein